ncbi:MAG: peptide deformylase [Alphaproteobacteria bacterium]|nr:peptide deformylase [Alphaproteobacteria bacterium]
MAILDIITAPDPRLKVKSTPVDRVDDEVRGLMDDLLETMYAEDNGVGLAAPQVGVAKRVLVIDLSRGEEVPDPLCMANPEVISFSEDLVSTEEGCLSVPEHYAEVVRPASVRLHYLDRDNEIREMDAEDFPAICIQHEIDHLDGVLFIDHLTAIKRSMILRKLSKTRKHTTAKTAATAPVL